MQRCSDAGVDITFWMFCLLVFASSLLFQGSALLRMMEDSCGQESFSLVPADALVLLPVHTNRYACT